MLKVEPEFPVRRSPVLLILHPSSFILLALAVRLYVLWQTPRTGFVIDEREYYQLGVMLAEGRGWAYFDTSLWVRPPLYPLFVAAIFKVFGYNLLWLRLIQIALSVGTVWLLSRIAARAYGEKVGFVTGLLAALAWPLATLATLLLSETLFFFLFLLAIYFLLRATSYEPKKATSLQLETDNTRQPAFPNHQSSIINHQFRLSSFILPNSAFLLAGFCLGLAALTRGQVLTFIPFIGLWLWLTLGWRNWKRAALTFGVVLAIFGLTIAPWMVRNFVTYGRPLLDTTGGYNLYLGAQGGRDEARLNQTLLTVANHADRETLAYRNAIELILAKPLDWLDKGVKEAGDFWRINIGAAERLEDGYSKGFIAPGWLVPGQLLGDTFYIIVATLGIIGLIAAGGNLRSFVALWTGYNWLLAFVFFAVTRFRLSVFLVLLIFAAYALVNARQIWAELKENRNWWACLAPALLFLAIVLPSYIPSPGQTLHGVTEWGRYRHTLRGDELRLAGQYDAALAEYRQASQYNQYTHVGAALSLAQTGRYDEALRELDRVNGEFAIKDLTRGWIYLQQGQTDFARSQFRVRQLSVEQLEGTNWAWHNLPVQPLPENRLQTGEFDWGYVNNFWLYEREAGTGVTFRWAAGRNDEGNAKSQIRLPLATGAPPKTLNLRLKNYRPPGIAYPDVTVYANGQLIGTLKPDADWQNFTLNLPNVRGKELIIEFVTANTFIPDARSGRDLAFMLQAAWLKS
jgi:4-amino-4-deoxy-L-arabinose transferase-like glycosyltransferase